MKVATWLFVFLGACGGLTALDDAGVDGATLDASKDAIVVDGGASADTNADAPSEAGLDGSNTITVLAPAENPPGPVDIAVDSTSVYWITGSGGVRKCAVSGCGGTPTTLADGLGPLCGMAIDPASVYWTACDTAPTVMKCSLGGCGLSPTTVASQLDFPQGIASDGTSVYWADPGGKACWAAPDAGTVARCLVGGCGGSSTLVASSQCGALRVAVDATNVYWTANKKVAKCAIGGCGNAPTTLAASAGPYGVAVDSTNVYWTDPQSGTVMKCAIGGCGGSPATLANGQSNPTAIATDGINVYWTNSSSFGQIMKCAVGGCTTPTLLADGQSGPTSIAIDVSSVYWGTTDAIVKLTPK